MREDEIVGHIHAYQTVVQVEAKRNALKKAAHKILTDELEVVAGDPPAEVVQHLDACIDVTLRRRKQTVSSRAPHLDMDAEGLAINKAMEAAIPALKKFGNGRIQRPRAHHFCNGCCLDANGETSRTVSVDHLFHALEAVGIFGGLVNTIPAKSRGLTASHILCIIVFGCMMFNLLPRAWFEAFAFWSIPAGVRDLDDFGKMVRSKAYRVKLWFAEATTPCMAIQKKQENKQIKNKNFSLHGNVVFNSCWPCRAFIANNASS